MKRKILLAVVGITTIVGLGLWWSISVGPLRNPEIALRDFYDGKDRAEDQLMDPLILNGRRVAPLVISAIPDKNMPKRRYAISFLANGKYEEALPVLNNIAFDITEKDYIRQDALVAINTIKQKPYHSIRSYWDALVNSHE